MRRGLPDDMKAKCLEYTADDMHEVMNEFDKKAIARKIVSVP